MQIGRGQCNCDQQEFYDEDQQRFDDEKELCPASTGKILDKIEEVQCRLGSKCRRAGEDGKTSKMGDWTVQTSTVGNLRHPSDTMGRQEGFSRGNQRGQTRSNQGSQPRTMDSQEDQSDTRDWQGRPNIKGGQGDRTSTRNRQEGNRSGSAIQENVQSELLDLIKQLAHELVPQMCSIHRNNDERRNGDRSYDSGRDRDTERWNNGDEDSHETSTNQGVTTHSTGNNPGTDQGGPATNIPGTKQDGTTHPTYPRGPRQGGTAHPRGGSATNSPGTAQDGATHPIYPRGPRQGGTAHPRGNKPGSN